MVYYKKKKPSQSKKINGGFTKKDGLMIHAKKRAFERYKIKLVSSDIKEIVEMIQEGYSNHIKKLTNNRHVHEVFYLNTFFYVIYDKSRKCLITFLPKKNEYNQWNSKETPLVEKGEA